MSVLDDLRLIDIATISTEGRLRPVDPVVAEGIAASAAQVGLLTPIDVCQLPGQKGFQLVFGGHRVAAVKLLGWETIPAFVRSNNALERLGREIAENLFKADLSPLDRATFVTKLIEVEKARQGIASDKDGNALNGDKRSLKLQARNDLCIVHKSLGLQDAVAAKLGLTQSTVSRTLALNGIAPSLIERLRKLPIADNAGALRKLAAMPWAKQMMSVDHMEAGKNLANALAIIDSRAPVSAEAKRLSTFLDTFGRMGRKEKMDALQALAKLVPPSVSIAFQEPAVPVRKSISTDYVVCLEDGMKLKSLRRHLRTKYNMSPDEYRAKWNLPPDYPMVAPNHARERDRLARELGLSGSAFDREIRKDAIAEFHAVLEAAE